MRCDQCKYWKADERREVPCVSLCTKAKELWECTEWQDEGDFERVLKPEFAELKMFMQDGSSYAAFLFTRADFFCAHFEKMPYIQPHGGSIAV